MVKRCVAAGCSNTYSDGVSLFQFPRDPVLRQQWSQQVRRTRARWSGPSEHSVLCSKHFTESCFEPSSALASKVGLEKRKRLKADAVPTIFERPETSTSSTNTSGDFSSQRKRAAVDTPLEESTGAKHQAKRARGAYEKRERARVRNQQILLPALINSYLYTLFGQILHDMLTHEGDQAASESPHTAQSDAEVVESDTDSLAKTHSVGIQVVPTKKNAQVQVLKSSTVSVGKSIITYNYT